MSDEFLHTASHDPGLLEVSFQKLADTAEDEPCESSFHAPLLSLARQAPRLDELRYRSLSVRFPFSNDAPTAPYFEQLQARTSTSEYQQATNRVAILIGESALAANLQYIPEETIIIMDYSPDMLLFMEGYVSSLRHAESPAEWQSMLDGMGTIRTLRTAKNQSSAWNREGLAHPLTDTTEFLTAQKAAQEKTIIPWRADIVDQSDMENLGDALRENDATVTMMNLTNVLTYSRYFRSAAECAAHLHVLPLSPQAPILTAGDWHEITGPFFGLDNLAAADKLPDLPALGTIANRVYSLPVELHPGNVINVAEVLSTMLRTVLRSAQE